MQFALLSAPRDTRKGERVSAALGLFRPASVGRFASFVSALYALSANLMQQSVLLLLLLLLCLSSGQSHTERIRSSRMHQPNGRQVNWLTPNCDFIGSTLIEVESC
jgi:hypothetical protein